MEELNFLAYVSPLLGQSDECEPSFLEAEFPEHVQTFTVDAFLAGEPAIVAPLQEDVFIVTEVNILELERSAQGAIAWNLVTQPAIFDPENLNLPLNSHLSRLNGTPIVGVAALGLGEFGISYGIEEALLTDHAVLPHTDGHLPVHVDLRIFLNDSLVIHKTFQQSAMLTKLASPTEPVSFLFDNFAFSGDFTIPLRRVHTAKKLKGSIEFNDLNNQLTSMMAFTAEVDAYGNVFGTLSAGSYVNQTGVAAYLRGQWNCGSLFISLENGTYLGDCALLIPSLQAGVMGTVKVEYIE